MRISILAVSVGVPRIIWTRGHEEVVSGIGKAPVTAARVEVGLTNIEGDRQADLRVHGGADKAVYAYTATHWPWWESEHGLRCAPATFGENLSLCEPVTESDVAIGDRFRWGDALLEVSQPRAPCYKLGIHTGRADIPQLMTISARCGFYMRVIESGSAPTIEGELARVHASAGPTVRDAFEAAMHPNVSRDARLRVRDAAALAKPWRHAVAKRLVEKAG